MDRTWHLLIDFSSDGDPFATVFDPDGDECVAWPLGEFTIRRLADLAAVVARGDRDEIVSFVPSDPPEELRG